MGEQLIDPRDGVLDHVEIVEGQDDRCGRCREGVEYRVEDRSGGAAFESGRGRALGEERKYASPVVVFADVGKPFLHYVQRSWTPAGAPMHTETGYLRVPAAGIAELILAQPMGQTELAEGSITAEADTLVLEFEARVDSSASAKDVEATRRRYELNGGRLTTTFGMAAVGQPMTHHLRSELRRV